LTITPGLVYPPKYAYPPSGSIAAERKYIFRLLREGKITDEARRRIERELDLEEASLAFKRKSEPDPPL